MRVKVMHMGFWIVFMPNPPENLKQKPKQMKSNKKKYKNKIILLL